MTKLKTAFMAEAFSLLTKKVDSPAAVEMFSLLQHDDMDEALEQLKNREIVKKMGQVLKEISPTMYNALLRDRDLHMVSKLRSMPGNMIVGVVGLGHLEGIEQIWNSAPIVEAK